MIKIKDEKDKSIKDILGENVLFLQFGITPDQMSNLTPEMEYRVKRFIDTKGKSEIPPKIFTDEEMAIIHSKAPSTGKSNIDLFGFIEESKNVNESFNRLSENLDKHLLLRGLIKNGKPISEKKLKKNKNLYSQLSQDELDYLGYLWFKQEKKTGERLHRQPRNYLKSAARLVGKSTDEPTLFTMTENKIDAPIDNFRAVISKNTAILGNYLLQLYQESGQEELTIYKLGPIAEMMGNSNYEIKIYLLYLGGYVYPIVDRDKSGGLTLTTEQLFKIQFKYGPSVASRYKEGITPEVGTGLIKFIKDEDVESITIKPSPLFIKALDGKDLGTVLVTDMYIKHALGLTDIAYKIFSYTSSNKPNQKISEDNLIKHLGLEKQVKTQGKPRVRLTILKGFQELQDSGHIKNYSFDEGSEIYVFNYSDKYILHRETKSLKS